MSLQMLVLGPENGGKLYEGLRTLTRKQLILGYHNRLFLQGLYHRCIHIKSVFICDYRKVLQNAQVKWTMAPPT